jgi:hypothetical protein
VWSIAHFIAHILSDYTQQALVHALKFHPSLRPKWTEMRLYWIMKSHNEKDPKFYLYSRIPWFLNPQGQ